MAKAAQAAAPPCHCSCDGTYCQEGECDGGALNATTRQRIISGRPWAVFVHGGDFTDYTPITGFYSQLTSRIVRVSGMGACHTDVHDASSLLCSCVCASVGAVSPTHDPDDGGWHMHG
eukprot:SAG25_NODE_898_length_4869_cov_112.186373_3_plen_118_part_00